MVIVADGAGPPSDPSVTTLFGMSTTTTASGSLKSNATTRPVSTSFGPISGSPNASSKIPPMYFVTSSELLNPIVPSLSAHQANLYSGLKNDGTYDRRHSQPRIVASGGLRQGVGPDDLFDDERSGLRAGGGASVGVLLDRIADVPQAFERGVARKVVPGDGALGGPAVARHCDVENSRAFVEAGDLVAKILQQQVGLGL